ncbi:MAG: hypothetical protein ABSD41_05100 [Candidatus Bathyarchaeia archaeon]
MALHRTDLFDRFALKEVSPLSEWALIFLRVMAVFTGLMMALAVVAFRRSL